MKRSVAIVVLTLSVGVAACDDRSEAAPESAAHRSLVAEAADAVPDASDAPATAVASPAVDHAAVAAIDGAPTFAALYPGAQTDGAPVMASGPDGPGGLITFTTPASPDEVVEFYRQRAERAGLAPVMAMNQGDARAYGAADDADKGASLQVVAAPGEDGLTSVQLTWNRGA